MKKPVRTPLTDEQLADAERLRAIYKKRVAESRARGDKPVLNQTEVGERCEWKSPQSAVSQYLNGNVALNLDALLKLSKALDFEPSDVSPTLAGGIRIGAISAEEEEDSSAEMVPVISARAAAGAGYDNTHIEYRDQWPFKRSWLKANRLKASSLVIITADGDSMKPTIFSHDQLLVDLSSKEPVDDQIFVLNNPSDGVLVKRLKKTAIGSWTIQSDNPEYEDRYPDRDAWAGHKIIGRVVWRGGEL